MSSERSPHDFVVAAAAYLDYAVAGDDVRRALQALTEIGRAAAAHEWGPFLGAGATTSDPDRARLREVAASAPELLARAASSAVSKVRRHGVEGVEDALYARSGYQALLEAGVWSEPPLAALGEDDLAEEIAELEVGGLRPPAAVPASHPWWSLLQ